MGTASSPEEAPRLSIQEAAAPAKVAGTLEAGVLVPAGMSIATDSSSSLPEPSSEPVYTIFGPTAKVFIVASVAISALISPWGANMFWPAFNLICEELHITPTQVNLSTTTYMVRYSSLERCMRAWTNRRSLHKQYHRL